MKSVHVVVSGRVQGVSFRKFVFDHAHALGVTGWVRNAGKDVEGVFVGEEKNVDGLLELCRQGPEASRVEFVSVEDVELIEEFEDFVVRESV